MNKKKYFYLLFVFIFLGGLCFFIKTTDVKIFMTFHKPFNLPRRGDILIPIQVGRDVETQKFLGGELTESDIKWLHENMIGDNIGDNISAKNRMFDVLTAYYYVWKHYRELGNPHYVGFVAHRKILITNPNTYRKFDRSGENYGYENKDLIPLLKKHRVITCHTLSYDDVDGYVKFFSVYDFYKRHHNAKDIDEMIRLIKLYYPEMVEAMDDVLYRKENEYAIWNYWIMEKKLAFEYFEKLFKIMFEIEKNRGEEILKYDVAQRRAIGYLAERFFAIWLEYKTRTEKLSPLFVEAQYL